MLLLTDRLEHGGAETHILTLAQALQAKGLSVTVASSGGALVPSLQEFAITHVTLPPCRLIHVLRIRRQLMRLCRKEHFFCIHAHARLPAFAAHRVAKRLTIPFVTTVHARFGIDPIRRRLSRWGDRTIAVSEDLKQYLCEEYGVFSDRVRVIPNGMPLSSHIPPDSDKPRLVFCSRLDEDCAAVALLLCRIAPRLRTLFPSLEILFIGGGNALPTLQCHIDAVHQASLASGSPFMTCVGSVTQPITQLRSQDIFIGVSRAALEAMSVGIPVILAGNEGFLGILDTDKL